MVMTHCTAALRKLAAEVRALRAEVAALVGRYLPGNAPQVRLPGRLRAQTTEFDPKQPHAILSTERPQLKAIPTLR